MTFSSQSPPMQSPGMQSPDLTRLRNPAVRHLAWMCFTAQLLEGPQVMKMSAYLPEDLPARLARWDADPAAGPAVLTAPAHPRLGMYFESLYACLLTDVLGWDLLARNLPIRRAGITLGELDFVVRNPHTGVAEHHEIALKFYLGFPGTRATDSVQDLRWYGPNARDRLDLKTRRLLDQQSQRAALPEAAAALRQRGIEQPQVSRIFMPGYLFYPLNTDVQAGAWVPVNHPRGLWCYLHDALPLDQRHWVPLRKPHWLGPWVQPRAPSADEREAALAEIRSTETPRLFAELCRDPLTGDWCEAQRIFVMPARWPGV